MDSHEQFKNLNSLAEILRAWRQAGRPERWLAIGGGLLTDLAGFAAHLCQAAIDLFPTTLLAMVDASVGGKTGVNFPPFGKNQVGAFAFPHSVTCWLGWLSTLPPRQIRSGLAECLKHALLEGDRPLLEELPRLLNTDQPQLPSAYLEKLIQTKAQVVSKDPTETGIRATLNLGHTLAHALEATSHQRTEGEQTLLHGEAVALGLAFAADLSVAQAGMPAADQQLIWQSLHKGGMMLGPELRQRLGVARLDDPVLWSSIVELLRHDKKNENQQTRWVLLERLGQPYQPSLGQYTCPIDNTLLQATWQNFLAKLESKATT